MKNLKWLFLLMFAASVHAQTYFQIAQTNFDGYNSPHTNSFAIPENFLFSVEGVSRSSGVATSQIYAEFSFSTNWCLLDNTSLASVSFQNGKVLGPAIIHVVTPAGANAVFVLTGKLEPVNVSPMLQGYAVQPNGMTAAVQLETSSDLTNWKSATNGVYAATNSAAFYRLNFHVR